jgi:hypothetical protein
MRDTMVHIRKGKSCPSDGSSKGKELTNMRDTMAHIRKGKRCPDDGSSKGKGLTNMTDTMAPKEDKRGNTTRAVIHMTQFP